MKIPVDKSSNQNKEFQIRKNVNGIKRFVSAHDIH